MYNLHIMPVYMGANVIYYEWWTKIFPMITRFSDSCNLVRFLRNPLVQVPPKLRSQLYYYLY